ncbi:MAG: hypothetical protein K0S75_317 [Clostridia bacterium]|jgi:hypothetical protein|nr:hypothetical protein [Clostridia bacterium]
MATWIAHLRVAEKLLEEFDFLDVQSFLVGNIGPDSGVPNEDWSEFSPPKVISHWYDKAGRIDSEDFRVKYLSDTSKYTAIEKSFYLGYYTHLLSDIEWGLLVKKKLEDPLYKVNLEKDPNFIWVIKEDWYGQDHLYLRDNKQSIFYKEFTNIKEFPNKYFDFYPPEAFTRQVNYISDFYINFNENLDRDFVYLSKEDMNTYVENTCGVITGILHSMYKAKDGKVGI